MGAPFDLYSRLPEVYQAEDTDGALQAFLAGIERVFGYLRDDIAQLYDDHFIETCAEWVIPYIADLVGASHLSGDPATLRADVADTVAMRRRKGTLGGIELLAFNLTRWGAHAVELRERLAWHQHLNHQRPDAGGLPAHGLPPGTAAATVPRTPASRLRPVRGGTVALRDPATLSLLGGAFDPFAYLADVRPPALDAVRHNLPNLAIFLWRLAAYRVPFARPVPRGLGLNMLPQPGEAIAVARFAVHPMGEPVRLFNSPRFDPLARPLAIGSLDHMPGPIAAPRLSTGMPSGNPGAYAAITPYNAAAAQPALGPEGLQLHLPPALAAAPFTFLGANLCAWESGLDRPLRMFEVAIDPAIGRLAIGLPTPADANAVLDNLLVTYTYGAVGPVGAHPDPRRTPSPQAWQGALVRTVAFDPLVNTLQQALDNLDAAAQPVIVEITDSRTYDLDLNAVAGTVVEAGGPALRLNHSLMLRARRGERPVVRLAAPLRFRPRRVADPDPVVQAQLEAAMDALAVRLEGVYLTRNAAMAAANAPLVARAAVHRLEIDASTLDPMGYVRPDLTREAVRAAADLRAGYGFAPGSAEDVAFSQTPEILVRASVTGPLLVDSGYSLTIEDSIVDAGAGPADAPAGAYAVASATDAANEWGPRTTVEGATFLGLTRVSAINACGGLFVHALQVEDTQHGCIKQSYFGGSAAAGFPDRLPQHYACVRAHEARLRFTAHAFGSPGYGQVTRGSDVRIRERGPGDDAMGATGFLREAHKWRNLRVRLEEHMPVGVRALPIAVT